MMYFFELAKKRLVKILIFTIRLYQKTISPDHGILKKIGIINRPVCVFSPTCSEYSIDSIKKYGPARGSYKTIKRILKCHPYQKNHIDPVD